MQIGLREEAKDFIHFVELACETEGSDGPLNLMYTIRGEAELEEKTLGHLDGYMGSKPVRVGNGASNQMQLDIYGELMDAVYVFDKDGTPISYALWKYLRMMLNWLMHNWRRADEGIWEVRGGRQQFVHSKMMCWVAFERGIRIAESRSFPSDRFEWIKTRDEIYEEIQEQGWSEELQSFTPYYGAQTLDASALLMPLVFFMAPQDPRMLSTIKATEEKLTYDSLGYRYDADESAPDGLEGDEGTFTMCTFWLVEALTKAGRLDDARFLFERMLGYSNHLASTQKRSGSLANLWATSRKASPTWD
jgi:GH15 family glucan-1,4-alpha-glucosidase